MGRNQVAYESRWSVAGPQLLLSKRASRSRPIYVVSHDSSNLYCIQASSPIFGVCGGGGKLRSSHYVRLTSNSVSHS